MLNLTLERFGCYRDSTTFSFPATGLGLIQGHSGRGKTTIIDGIAFALYGSKEYTRVSWGEKKSKVILSLPGPSGSGDWVVTRTKSPVSLRLVAGLDESLGEDAQERIDARFGANFSITSYVTQDSTDTFFSMTANARMAFLEKIALGDSDVAEIKKKCKEKIKERKARLTEIVSELKLVSEESSRLKEPTPVPFPLSGKYTELKVKNEGIRQKKNTTKLAVVRSELAELLSLQTQHDLAVQRKNQLTSQLEDIQTTLADLRSQLVSTPFHDVALIEARIAFLILNRDLTRLRTGHASDLQQYQAACCIELAQYQEEIDELQTHPTIQSRVAELQANIQAKKARAFLVSSLESLKTSLEEMDNLDEYTAASERLEEAERDLIKLSQQVKLATTIHRCPGCKVSLRFGKDKLELSTEQLPTDLPLDKDIQTDLKRVRKERAECVSSIHTLNSLLTRCSKLTMELSSLAPVDETIDYESALCTHQDALQEQKTRQARVAYLQRKISNEEFSASTQALSRRLEQKAIEIKKLEAAGTRTSPEVEGSEDIDELQERVAQSRLNNQKHEILQGQAKKAQVAAKNLQKQIDGIKVDEEADYPGSIEEKEEEVKSLQALAAEFDQRKVLLGAYMEYSRLNTEYQRWKVRLEHAQADEARARTSLAVAEKFLRKIGEVEGTAVLDVIGNINQHLDFYLGKFFDDPIAVEIRSFKDIKSTGETKPDINIQISYKGCDECGVKDLSGGERARVELSICLAINSVAGGSLILLDEMCKSLGADDTSNILEVLRQLAKDSDKLILTVCHQTNQADFDFVVKGV